MNIAERRSERSDRTDEALGLLLEYARQRLGVRAIALSTETGAVVAGAGEGVYQLAQLGAAAANSRPRSGIAGDVPSAPIGVRMRPGVATWRMRVGQRDLLLTSAGPAMDPGLGAGVRRILSE